MPEYEAEHLPAYFELWLEHGRIIERSESLGTEDEQPLVCVVLATGPPGPWSDGRSSGPRTWSARPGARAVPGRAAGGEEHITTC